LDGLRGSSLSTPRRFAVHLPPWLPYDRVGAIGATLAIVTMLVFTFQLVVGLLRPPGRAHFLTNLAQR